MKLNIKDFLELKKMINKKCKSEQLKYIHVINNRMYATDGKGMISVPCVSENNGVILPAWVKAKKGEIDVEFLPFSKEMQASIIRVDGVDHSLNMDPMLVMESIGSPAPGNASVTLDVEAVKEIMEILKDNKEYCIWITDKGYASATRDGEHYTNYVTLNEMNNPCSWGFSIKHLEYIFNYMSTHSEVTFYEQSDLTNRVYTMDSDNKVFTTMLFKGVEK